MRPSSRKLVRQSAPLPVEEQTQVHVPLPSAARGVATLLALFLFIFAADSPAASVKDVDSARREYDKNNFEASRDSYARLLAEKKPPADEKLLAYGLGASAHNLKDYERSVRAFSDALKSRDPVMQKDAHRGLATSLYNEGDEVLAKQPESTVKIWTESVAHFNSALRLLARNKESDDYKEIKENRDFVKKRLDDLKQEQEKQEQGKSEKKEKKKGEKGEGEPQEGDEEEEGEPKDQDKDQDGKSGDKDQKKEHDAMQNKQEQAPEGQLEADKSNKKPEPQPQQTENDNQKNDKTGYTPAEARAQLRAYADDKKSMQYLMKRERPENGKDY